jgi:hypothetical protein
LDCSTQCVVRAKSKTSKNIKSDTYSFFRTTGSIAFNSSCSSTALAGATDDPKDISSKLGVATDKLLAANNIPVFLNGSFGAETILCLDQVQQCNLHTVKVGDTCSSLVASAGHGVNEVMLKGWNPTLGFECGNLLNMVGKHVCISPPGQTTKVDIPVGTATPTTSVRPVIQNVVWVPAPDAQVDPTSNFSINFPFPTAMPKVAVVNATAPSEAIASAIDALTGSPMPFSDRSIPESMVHAPILCPIMRIVLDLCL